MLLNQEIQNVFLYAQKGNTNKMDKGIEKISKKLKISLMRYDDLLLGYLNN